ncbi:hypothetical protein AB0N87_28720 [Streptomyces sp. NPDC093228]|uniref:hypothetical protein n=1 Tax=Streptomyces sp. NPDC093228 TaxID=3155070 RepID=UPI003424A319
MTDSAVGPSMRPHLTSNRIRRHAAEPATSLPDGQLTQIMPEPPPASDRPPRPLGELSSATIDKLVALVAEEFADVSRNTRADYKHGMRRLLHLLAAEPGQTWQERWEAAGLNQPGRAVTDLADGHSKWRSRLAQAAGIAFAMRLIQPTEEALRATHPPSTPRSSWLSAVIRSWRSSAPGCSGTRSAPTGARARCGTCAGP